MVRVLSPATETRKYLLSILRKRRYDIIVGIERKGLALVREALRYSLSKKFPRLVFLSSGSVDFNDFKGKSVLVFDDALNTGRRARETMNSIRKSGAAKVDVAILAKLTGSKFPTLKPVHRFAKGRYRSFTHIKMVQYIASQLVPADADHIYVLGRLKPAPSSTVLRATLDTLGVSYDKTREGYRVSRFGIREVNFLKLAKLQWVKPNPLPQLKIRVNYQHTSESNAKRGEVCLLPIAFPLGFEFHSPPRKHSVGFCFCKRYRDNPWVRAMLSKIKVVEGESRDKVADWFIYEMCIQFNITCYLLKAFLRKWRAQLRESRCTFVFEKIDFQRAVEVIRDPKLIKYLERLVIEA